MSGFGNRTPRDRIDHIATPRPTRSFRDTWPSGPREIEEASGNTKGNLNVKLRSTLRVPLDHKGYSTHERKENAAPKPEKDKISLPTTPRPGPKVFGSNSLKNTTKSSMKLGILHTQKTPNKYNTTPRIIRPATAGIPKVSVSSEGSYSHGTSAAAVIHGRKSETVAKKAATPRSFRRSDSIFMNAHSSAPLQTLFVKPRSSVSTLAGIFGRKLSNGKDSSKNEESSSVQVGIRVRPLNPREIFEKNITDIIKIEENEIHIQAHSKNNYMCAYDHCFSSSTDHPNYASQKTVYDKMAAPLLDHAFDGYNVCIFAYGQTGSGKSYCIMGEGRGVESENEAELSDEVGITPRFCKDLFAKIDQLNAKKDRDQRCLITAEMTYVEIYNEKIYDLLSVQSGCAGDNEKREVLKIREHPSTGPYVEGASTHLVTSYVDVHTWLMLGNKQRSIAATAMNDQSSRSHSVFSIVLTQTWMDIIDGKSYSHSITSKINLVDLAGSERIGVSDAENERLKEGVSINKSLLNLGIVINALADNTEKRRTHISYRDSSLTWLLKESLGGNSKTTMIATISPSSLHYDETVSTLRYACHARKIINWNHVNEDPSAIVKRALKMEVERLKAAKDGTKGQFDEDAATKATGNSEEESRLKMQEEIVKLKNMLKSTQSDLIERTRLYENKLKTAESQREEALERCKMSGILLKIENNQPALVNLCEDGQLSQTLLYTLKDGKTTLGNGKSNVELKNLHTNDIHCIIDNKDGQIMLNPQEGSETFINGKRATSQQQIFHNDRIVLDGIYYFRLKCQSQQSDPSDVEKLDFYYARDELLKEQENLYSDKIEEQKKAAKLEILQELADERAKLEMQRQSMNAKVRRLASELKAEKEQNHVNELLRIQQQEQMEFLEDAYERGNVLPDFVSSSTSMINDETEHLKDVAAILEESMQMVESNNDQATTADVELCLLANEATKICNRLMKPYEFQQHCQLTKHGILTAILVCDRKHNLSATLNVQDFKDCLHILHEIAAGRQRDNNIFETSLKWERQGKTTKMPLVINKLKESAKRVSLSTTFDCSDASINPGSLSQISMRDVPPKGHVVVATVLQEMLAKSLSHYEKGNIYYQMTQNFGQMHKLVEKLLVLNRQQAYIFDEEEYVTTLMKLAFCCQKTCSLHSNLLNENFTDDCTEIAEYTNKFLMAGEDLSRIMIRMMQGVQNEVTSLFEKEASLLKDLLCELLDDVGFLSVLSENAVHEAYTNLGDNILCRGYLIGASRGLEWQIERGAKRVERDSKRIAASSCNDNSSKEIARCRSKANKMSSFIASFLSLFSQLNVAPPELDDKVEEKTARRRTIKFISRIAKASGNTLRLTKVLLSILREIHRQNKGKLNISSLLEEVTRLQESLGELVKDADVGSDYKADDVSSSNVSSCSNQIFFDSLHEKAVAAKSSIISFQSVLTTYRDARALKSVSSWNSSGRNYFDLNKSIGDWSSVTTNSGSFHV